MEKDYGKIFKYMYMLLYFTLFFINFTYKTKLFFIYFYFIFQNDFGRMLIIKAKKSPTLENPRKSCLLFALFTDSLLVCVFNKKSNHFSNQVLSVSERGR